MAQTETLTSPHRERNGADRIRPAFRSALLLAAAFLFVPAVRAQSGYTSSGGTYSSKSAQSGPSISSGLSSVSRPGSSVYSRKGAAAAQKSAELVELYADDEKPSAPARTPSVSVPRSPLAAARAAQPNQPKIVDDELLSELSHPVPRPGLSNGGHSPGRDPSAASPSAVYSYFDDSDFPPADLPLSSASAAEESGSDRSAETPSPSETPQVNVSASEVSQVAPPAPASSPREETPEPPLDAPLPTAGTGTGEFADLETFDAPAEQLSEPSGGFQSFAEGITSDWLNRPAETPALPETPRTESLAGGEPPAAPLPGEETAETPSETPLPTAAGNGEFADLETLETFDAPAELPAPAESAAAAGPADAALPAAEPAPRFDSGFTVSDGTGTPAETASAPGSPPLPAETGSEADVPPGETEFPEFARNAYEALEPSDAELADVIDREKGKPQRERKSIAEKEAAEQELKAEYDAWLAKQRASQEAKAKLPRYLQPLDDDHAVFESEDSPYARGRQDGPAEEHKFVREISAADLNLMSDVSSNRELMDWEKEQDAPVDWSKYSASTLYNKWRDYIGMGPNEKEALAIMKKATLELMEWEKTKDPKKLRQAGELYEKAGKKWPESILEEDALFYAGECFFFDKNYTKAKTFYKGLLAKYSNSVLRRDAMERLYWIGVYWVKCAEEDPEVIGRFEGKERPRFSDFAGAKDAFETIFTNDVSDRGRAPDAVFALANAYMRRGVQQGDASFEEAAKYYQRLYEFYPACKYADKAYQLAMLALYQSYRGPFYDSTPLRRAEEIAKAAQRARKGDQKVIEEQLRLIREKQAEYLLVRGEYYEKKKIYASARSYYQRLIDEYPDSEYAAKGAERYTAIRENPAEKDQFALIRPIAPFLPDSKNQYFEDQPAGQLSAAGNGGEHSEENDIARSDFTQLEKTAETERPEGEMR